ncbi:MAG: MBL fold metallo-hydrolase [Dehalococcoidia bacterium]|nr:MAG: MBL fold metallo-hydrolase [Dehalococcoidia bacterium]
MHIKQFVASSLGDASYLVASGDEAAVIDPQRDIRPYLAAAEEFDATIRYVFETHVHNDYISGGPELAALGATVVAPEDSGLEFAHRSIADGDEVMVGAGRIRAVRTPGHTYHHMAYLGIDESGEVAAAFTGGSIIIGGAGRTDLLGPEHTEELTRLQWESAQRIQSLLPERAELLPTHGTGSFCSAQPGSGERRASLLEERVRNVVLASPDFEPFRVLHLANPGPIPAYYRHMAPINRAGAEVYGIPPRPALLTPSDLEREAQAGTPVIDVRDRFDFARAHVPASISLEEGPSTLAYLSWATAFDSALVLVVEDGEQADRFTADLLGIGYEEVRGYLPFETWRTADRPIATLDAVDVAEAVRIHQDGRRTVYDVRFDRDRRELDLPESVHRPIDRLAEWLPQADAPSPLVVCGGGSRATTVASILQAHGRTPTVLIDGGAADLRDARQRVEA